MCFFVRSLSSYKITYVSLFATELMQTIYIAGERIVLKAGFHELNGVFSAVAALV